MTNQRELTRIRGRAERYSGEFLWLWGSVQALWHDGYAKAFGDEVFYGFE